MLKGFNVLKVSLILSCKKAHKSFPFMGNIMLTLFLVKKSFILTLFRKFLSWINKLTNSRGKTRLRRNGWKVGNLLENTRRHEIKASREEEGGHLALYIIPLTSNNIKEALTNLFSLEQS